MNKLTITTLSVLFSTVFIIPSAIAQMEEPNETRIQKYEDLTETDPDMTSQSEEGMEGMESESGAMEPETRTEETLEEAQTDSDMTSPSGMEDMEGMESESGAMEPETRTEETLEEAQSSDFDYSGYDVRRTEAFNLVSSAYRGDFEDQGINSYAVLVTNYEEGELTAEDLVNAAIDAGELSPSALEDDSYIEAVDSQLSALTQS